MQWFGDFFFFIKFFFSHYFVVLLTFLHDRMWGFFCQRIHIAG